MLVGQLVAAFGLNHVAGLGEFGQRRARAPTPDPGRRGDLAGRLGAVLECVEDLRARLTRGADAAARLGLLAAAERFAAAGFFAAGVLGGEALARVRLPGTRAATAPARNREVLRLRFTADLKQREIGAIPGTSQMHVSRLIRQSLEQLQAIAAAEANSDGHPG